MKQLELFENEDDDFDLEEAENFISGLESRIEELENEERFLKENKAFNWNSEFPQLCDAEGNWEGFDAIVGNPPYIDIKNLNKDIKEYYNEIYPEQKNSFDLYTLFIQNSFRLIKKDSYISFIVPRPLLYNSTFQPIRKFLFENTINEIFINEKLVFEKAAVETIMLMLSNRHEKNTELIINSETKQLKTEIIDEYLNGAPIILSDNKTINLISKLNKLSKLDEYIEITRGLELGKNTLLQQNKESSKTTKIFAGEAFNKYNFDNSKFIIVSKKDLSPYQKNVDERFIRYPRILMRRVAQEPILTIINEGEVFLNNLNSVYNIVIKNENLFKKEY